MKGRFKFVIPSFNCPDFIAKNLASIESQTNKNYDVCVIDDGSTIAKQREIIFDYCERNGWKYIFQPKNLGALTSTIDGIKALDCQDEDVICIVDGDDWLYDNQVVSKLDKIYTEEDVWMTYGQFETYPKGCLHIIYAMAATEEVITFKLYREIPDIFFHLRTFKYLLFRRIKDADLRDPLTGNYFTVSGDKALMYPMLEMAGTRIRFVDDHLYVYNMANPLNDFKINRPEQAAATDYIRKKARYNVLEQS